MSHFQSSNDDEKWDKYMSDPSILYQADDVSYALARLGLDRDGLVECVRVADAERALCSSNDIRGFDLILMNDKVGRALRERFVGREWEKDEHDNQPGIRNPARRLRIIPCNFDDGAGRIDRNPSNLCTKGTATRSKTRCNLTPWLSGLDIPEYTPPGAYTTYVLGTYFEQDAENNNFLRSELSLPLDFQSGHYKLFNPRIIILDGSEPYLSGVSRQDRQEPTEIIDIQVARK
jgi:hypothetical protein